MTIRPLRFAATCTLVAAGLAAAAEAQSLSERINAVTEQRAAQQNLSKSGLLRALISTGVSVRFSETPAKEAFAYLKQLTGVDLTVRWSSDPGASDGFDPEAPITLEVNNGQALVVLERMIEQASTEPSTWQLRDGYVEVGPKSRLSVRNAQETRIYPIRDLLFEAPNFDNAPEFNLNQAMQAGGMGGMGGGMGGGGFGGGGGGGFGGGGGGGFGGGGGGMGGTPFGESGEQPERRSAQEKAEELIDLIKSLVEPDAWLDESVASIRYYDGSIIVRAPDFIQRQIGGYGMLPPAPPSAGGGKGGRYVGLNLNLGFQQLQGFTPATVSGAAGGGGTGNFIPAGAEAPATGAPATGAPPAPPAPPAGGQGGTGRKGAPPAGAPSGGSGK